MQVQKPAHEKLNPKDGNYVVSRTETNTHSENRSVKSPKLRVSKKE